MTGDVPAGESARLERLYGAQSAAAARGRQRYFVHRTLGVDYLDLLLIHWPDPETPIDETMRALNDIRQAGTARYVGPERSSAAEQAAADREVRAPMTGRVTKVATAPGTFI